MDFGAHLPLISFQGERRSLDDLIRYTQTANSLGYTYLCANDHLASALPWLDGPTALAAVIAHSGDMRLATTICLPVVRGPAPAAKLLAAIDLLSGGRLVVGAGPGSRATDHNLVGLDYKERWQRLEESIHALRAYFGAGDFEGKFYSTLGQRFEPRPAQEPAPPIWLGIWGAKGGLRRTAITPARTISRNPCRPSARSCVRPLAISQSLRQSTSPWVACWARAPPPATISAVVAVKSAIRWRDLRF